MESHNDKSQAPLKFANYDEKSKPVKPEKRLDPGVPIARKTITHKSNGNADGFGRPSLPGNYKPGDFLNPNEPPRRPIAFKTIVPLKRPMNASKSPEQLKPTQIVPPKAKPVIYMRNLRLSTPKTTEMLIQKYSSTKNGPDISSNNDHGAHHTSMSSASSVTSVGASEGIPNPRTTEKMTKSSLFML